MYLRTISSIPFSLDKIVPGSIRAWDIAWALAQTNRYNGHTPVPYDVLSHTGLCCMMAVQHLKRPLTTQESLWLLLHDASEAYLGDMVHPLKSSPVGDMYRQVESTLSDAIYLRFGIDPATIDTDFVARYDIASLHAEYRVFHPEISPTKLDRQMDYELGIWPTPHKADPVDYIDMLRSRAIQAGAKDVNKLFEFPDVLKPYLKKERSDN